MSDADPWRLLEIEPTSDQRVVRRAYAAKLKSTHPEDDPTGFQALREAYELAAFLAERKTVEDVVLHNAMSGALEQDAPPQDEAPQHQDPFADHRLACNRLVQVAVDGAPAEELLQALDALLGSPALENLDVYAGTGFGLARALLDIAPRGDVLVEPLIRRFGWRGDGVMWGRPPELEALLLHAERIVRRESLLSPHDPLNAAYRVLKSTAPPKKSRRTSEMAGQAKRFLRYVREEAPWLMDDLNPDSVAWWERQQTKRPKGRWVARVPVGLVAGVLMIGVVQLLNALDRAATAPDAPAVIESQTRDNPEIMQPERVLSGSYEEVSLTAYKRWSDKALWARLCAMSARDHWRTAVVQDCNHALELQPTSARVRVDIGFLHLKRGEYDTALSSFDEALDLDPEQPWALYGSGLVHAVQGREEDARRDRDAARALQGDVLARLGNAYELEVPPSLQ